MLAVFDFCLLMPLVELERIKVNDETDNYRLVPYYTWKFESKDAAVVLDVLNALYPMDLTLRHLKRIRPIHKSSDANDSMGRSSCCLLEALLKPANGSINDALIELDVPGELGQVVHVPSVPFKTKAEWEVFKGWPCSFHASTADRLEQETRQKLLAALPSQFDHYSSYHLAQLTDKLTLNILYTVKDGSSCQSQNIFDHFVMKLIDARSAAILSSKVDYLCTGLTAILPKEPCLMCAMALTHSRIKHVIIYNGNNKNNIIRNNEDHDLGGEDRPWSVSGLHHLPGINHHYEVYKTKL